MMKTLFSTYADNLFLFYAKRVRPLINLERRIVHAVEPSVLDKPAWEKTDFEQVRESVLGKLKQDLFGDNFEANVDDHSLPTAVRVSCENMQFLYDTFQSELQFFLTFTSRRAGAIYQELYLYEKTRKKTVQEEVQEKHFGVPFEPADRHVVNQLIQHASLYVNRVGSDMWLFITCLDVAGSVSCGAPDSNSSSTSSASIPWLNEPKCRLSSFFQT